MNKNVQSDVKVMFLSDNERFYADKLPNALLFIWIGY